MFNICGYFLFMNVIYPLSGHVLLEIAYGWEQSSKKDSHNLLRWDRVPRVDSSRGPVGELEWVIFARVASNEGLIVCVKNHAGTWLCAHVKIDIPSWVEWICRLNPTTDIT